MGAAMSKTPIEIVIDALNQLPNDTFGFVADTPDQQGWWIRDELVDALCRERQRIEKLEKWKQWADEDAIQRNQENQRLRTKLEAAEALLDDIASLYRTCDADWCGKSGPDSECFACKVGHILAKREQT
jgi:hypothetical protein